MGQKLNLEFEKPLTTAEAADFLQIHPNTLVKWARLEIIPGKKVGHVWRFLPSVLDSFLRTGLPSK